MYKRQLLVRLAVPRAQGRLHPAAGEKFARNQISPVSYTHLSCLPIFLIASHFPGGKGTARLPAPPLPDGRESAGLLPGWEEIRRAAAGCLGTRLLPELGRNPPDGRKPAVPGRAETRAGLEAPVTASGSA